MPKKVAIIEDEPAISQMYRFKFEAEGYEVEVAPNGQVGLELAEKMRPDIILLDLMMPVMSGDVMLRKLRETEWGADIRVIVLTNLSKNEAPQEFRMLHVDRYVLKAHYTPSQVVEIVHEVLSQQ
jgi:two-component system phosphate regulon response regulator PhoB